MKTASSIFFAFCFQALHVIASAQLNNYVADIEVTDNGIKCVTPCGQDGLFEERYWCHTADAWDYCHLRYKDSEVTDKRLECVTPCGQDGLHEGRYWCHTSDATDTWDYCNLQYKVETSVVKNVRNTRLRPRVSKTGIIDKIFNFLSRFSRKPRQHGSIKKQDGAFPAAPAFAVVFGGIVVAIAVAGLLNQTPATQPVPVVIIGSSSGSSNAVVPRVTLFNQNIIAVQPVVSGGRRRKRAVTIELRKNLITVLELAFCNGLLSFQVIPTCGSRCNIQAEHIEIKEATDGSLEVTFVLVISTLTTNQAGIQAKINRIHNSLTGKTLNDFTFPDPSTGTYTDCAANPTWCQTCPGGDDFKSAVGCPTSASVCAKFECTKNSHCRNGGTCNVLSGECLCKTGFVGSDCTLPIACGLNKSFLGGLCCPEGQVNTGLGVTPATGCADKCSDEMPVLVGGTCGCALDKAMYSKLDGTPLCCDEGQVQNGDECADQCPNGMPLPVGGICSCGNDKTMFTKLDGSALCCDEGKVNDAGTCVDVCSGGQDVTNGVCDKP